MSNINYFVKLIQNVTCHHKYNPSHEIKENCINLCFRTGAKHVAHEISERADSQAVTPEKNKATPMRVPLDQWIHPWTDSGTIGIRVAQAREVAQLRDTYILTKGG